MEHIVFDKILSYSDNQLDDKETHEIEGHLATCERCHEIFMGLKSVETTLSRSFKEETASASCPEHWEIAAFIKKELPSEASDKIKGHVKDCGYCIDEAASHYKALQIERAPVETPELWKQKVVERMEARQVVKEPGPSLVQRIVSFFTELAFPLPAAAGLAAALLAIAVVSWIIVPEKARFTVVASNEKIVIRDSEIPSALGFMGTGETQEVSNMEIALNGKEVIFMWKPIEGAVEYKFTLKDGGKEVYDIKTGKDVVVTLTKDLIETHITYNWLITGKTSDDRYFEYTGDFVLVK